MEAWIDTYHAVEGLARLGPYSFLTDGAVGAQEEDNLRHLIANLGDDVSREHIVPYSYDKTHIELLPSVCGPCLGNRFPVFSRAWWRYNCW